MKKLVIIMVLSCAWPAATHAMRIRTDVTLVALADGGESFLVLVSESGPEGGGSSTYKIYDARRGTSASFAVSSDFSPGDGSTPERIPAASCKAAAARLKALLAKKKISGVAVQPDRCARKGRIGLVGASAAARKRVQAAAFAHKKGVPGLTRGGLVVGKASKQLGLWPCTAAPAAVTSDGVSYAYLSPHGKVVVVLAGGLHDTRLGPVWYSSSGEGGTHKKVAFAAGRKH